VNFRSDAATSSHLSYIIFRNLCAQDWVANNPGGLAIDFKNYFDNLPKEELKVGLHCTVPTYADVVVSIRQVWKEKEKAAVSHFRLKSSCSFTYGLQKSTAAAGEKGMAA